MSDEYLQYVSVLGPENLEDLMRAYGRDVWNYAYFLTRSRDRADDIFQDAFLKAYRGIEGFRGQGSVKSWLLTIVRNTAYNQGKSAFLRKVMLFGAVPERGTHRSAEEDYLSREYTGEIWGLVMALPLKYREILLLDAVYQMPDAEIARMTGLSVGAVKTRLRRARMMISNQLKEEMAHGGA